MPSKIVIIEDDPLILERFHSTLKEMGYEIYSAGDGKAGIDLINKVKPDLIITDLNMPQMSGYYLSTVLKGDPVFKDTPLIVVTGMPLSYDRQGKVQVGNETYSPQGNLFLVKPIRPRTLQVAVQKLLTESAQTSAES